LLLADSDSIKIAFVPTNIDYTIQGVTGKDKKVNLSLCLSNKHYAKKTYGRVDV
jgi:hypothetical protein